MPCFQLVSMEFCRFKDAFGLDCGVLCTLDLKLLKVVVLFLIVGKRCSVIFVSDVVCFILCHQVLVCSGSVKFLKLMKMLLLTSGVWSGPICCELFRVAASGLRQCEAATLSKLSVAVF